MSTAAAEGGATFEEKYAMSMRWLHWAMAAGTLGCFGTVQYAMSLPKTEGKKKGDVMSAHKSFGLLMGILIPARIGARLASTIPKHLPGPTIQKWGGDAAHTALYGFMMVMPASGIAMGYYGGKGLPFFGFHIPGAEKPVGEIAKNAFKVHTQAGFAFEMLVPLHVAGAGVHFIQGHKVLSRMNPLVK